MHSWMLTNYHMARVGSGTARPAPAALKAEVRVLWVLLFVGTWKAVNPSDWLVYMTIAMTWVGFDGVGYYVGIL